MGNKVKKNKFKLIIKNMKKRILILVAMFLTLCASCDKKSITGNEDKIKCIVEGAVGTSNINCAQYSPDGNKILFTVDSTVKIWDANNGTPLKTFKGDMKLHSASWSPDGKTIAIADKRIKLWNIETEEVRTLDTVDLQTEIFNGADVHFSPKGDKLVVSNGDGQHIQIWDIKTEKKLYEIIRTGNISWSPDGNSIAVGTYAYYSSEKFVYELEDGTIVEDKGAGMPIDSILTIIDVNTGKTIKTFYKPTSDKKLQGKDDLVYSAEISPNGKLLLSSGYDKTIKIWDIESTKLLKTLDFGDVIFMSKWSPDGSRIASISFGKTIKIYNAETGECLRTINDDYRPYSISFSPDGTKILTAGEKGFKIWGV